MEVVRASTVTSQRPNPDQSGTTDSPPMTSAAQSTGVRTRGAGSAAAPGPNIAANMTPASGSVSARNTTHRHRTVSST